MGPSIAFKLKTHNFIAIHRNKCCFIGVCLNNILPFYRNDSQKRLRNKPQPTRSHIFTHLNRSLLPLKTPNRQITRIIQPQPKLICHDAGALKTLYMHLINTHMAAHLIRHNDYHIHAYNT